MFFSYYLCQKIRIRKSKIWRKYKDNRNGISKENKREKRGKYEREKE